MLSKCANPACSASFRNLHQGRIFTLVLGPEPSGASEVWDHQVGRPVERYWLCDVCAQSLTLGRSGTAVVVRPMSQARRLSLTEAA